MTDNIRSLEFLGYPHYGVDRSGNIYSKLRRGTRGKADSSYAVVKLGDNSHGYRQAVLRANKIPRTFKVHRLVAYAFLDLPLNSDLQVNHIDGDKSNNSVANLEIVTASENISHAFKIGLIRRRGVNNSQAKLDDIKVMTIKTLIEVGYRNKDLTEYAKVSNNTVSNIRYNKSWTHI